MELMLTFVNITQIMSIHYSSPSLSQSSWQMDDILAIAPDMLFITFSEAVPQLSSTNPFPSLSLPSPHTSIEPINGLIRGDGSLAKEILISGKTDAITRAIRIWYANSTYN